MPPHWMLCTPGGARGSFISASTTLNADDVGLPLTQNFVHLSANALKSIYGQTLGDSPWTWGSLTTTVEGGLGWNWSATNFGKANVLWTLVTLHALGGDMWGHWLHVLALMSRDLGLEIVDWKGFAYLLSLLLPFWLWVSLQHTPSMRL